MQEVARCDMLRGWLIFVDTAISLDACMGERGGEGLREDAREWEELLAGLG